MKMLNKTNVEKNMKFMSEAIKLSETGMETNCGGPFGAVVIKDGIIIGRGYNQVLSSNDPTAHAEIVAIREASRILKTHDLSGCEIYASCEPCPMCLSAIYWANIKKVYYANTKKDAAAIGFRDDFIYEEICRPIGKREKDFQQISREEAGKIFVKWKNKPDRVKY